jgi:hypothetical protein
MALAGLFASGLLLLPALADAGPRDRKLAQPAAAAASPPAAKAPRVSPYAMVARRNAEARATGHTPVVPPSMQRTRQPIGRPSRP